MEKKSSFQFKGYKVLKSFISINDVHSDKLTLEFEPKGILNHLENIFILELNLNVFDDEKNISIEVTFRAEYLIEEKDDNFKSFILMNAPAILFPYVRAYITALTALSGISPVTLPTMNLAGLRDKLEVNLTEIN